MDKERKFIQGDIKTKKDMSNMAAGGHMVIADFEPPKGERQMRADQAQTLMAAAQIISRFQMLTEKEADQILEICENAAVRCGFFKGATEEEGDKCGKGEN